MKFLLPNWKKDRFDLLKSKPVDYPDTKEGKAVREAIGHARSSEAAKVLRQKVRNAEE